MTHKNLFLTEKAVKNHSKRLQKELKEYNPNLSLGESQNLFSKILGFNNYHELKEIFNKEDAVVDFDLKIKKLRKEELTKYIKNCISNENENDLISIINYISNARSPQFSLCGIIFLITYGKVSTSFKNKILACMTNHLILEKNNAENILINFCITGVNEEILGKIIKMYPFEKIELQKALINACEYNRVETVKYLLLNYELDINDVFYIEGSQIGFNPLCCAIRIKCYETVDLLLNSTQLKINSNPKVENNLPLLTACRVGDLKILKLLTNSLPNQMNDIETNDKCISGAYKRKHFEAIRLLINEPQFKISPNLYEKVMSELGKSPK